MRPSAMALAASLAIREAPVVGAALLALLLVVAMLHQDARLARDDQPAPPAERQAADGAVAAMRADAAEALEPIRLRPPPPPDPGAEPTPEPEPAPQPEPVLEPEPAPQPGREVAAAPPATASGDPEASAPDGPHRSAPAAIDLAVDGTEAPTRPEAPAADVLAVAPPPAAALRPATVRPPLPRPERTPQAAAAPMPPGGAAIELRTDGAVQRRGRVLLQLLESGTGPNVIIAWPSAADEQERLAAVLARCYGMELALLRRDNTVLRAADPPGTSRPLDLDRWSRFPRAPSGVVTAFERSIEADLRRHHRAAGGLFDSRPVRLFPREVDAALLGGLEALLGRDYAEAKEIHLAYELRDATVRLVDLRRDGAPVPGALALPKVGTCRE